MGRNHCTADGKFIFIYVIQGIVLKKLIRSVKYGALIRIVIVAILFCLWHVQSVSDLNNPFFYQYLSLGWLAYIYEQTGNFVKTWIAHMGMNMIPMVAELLISGVIF
ncbi:CPBP family intramembrane glutamic endopeptidase [Paucilactobacillus hokkaidonensis]|uniref:CPBP family intramembrane glutamic endopeptidase n=1 Tax=Paucilactobacillus hokkaidonensis TaxID=1193095 RepID=UPI0006D0ABE6|nr:CPBP family intramembrane glutamic endopeptidase [Paucilactobacillus hokkaidonensis]